MTTIFTALNTANTALGSDQIAIETIGHNVANAGTNGYSIQTANLQATPPYTVPSMVNAVGPGQIGTGVEVTTIGRGRDALLDGQFRYENQFAGQYSTLDTQYTQVQGILPEPSTTGLGAQLSAFWNGWQALADDPTNQGARAQVQQNGVALAAALNSDAQQLTQAQQTADNYVGSDVTTINNIATQIANLNGQIAAVGAVNQQPNDLLDQRDVMLDQLSNIVPITYTTQTNGMVTVNLATQVPGSTTLQVARPSEAPLISGTTTNLLVAVPMGVPTYADGNAYMDPILFPTQPAPIGGTLGAAIRMRDNVIGGATGLITQLNNIAQALAQDVNVQHAAGYDLNGNTNKPFFNVAPPAAPLTAPFSNVSTVTAANITVDPAIVANPQAIMAATTSGAVGDGSNAQAISNQRSTVGAVGSPLPGVTIEKGYENIITTLGASAQLAHNNNQAQSTVMQSLTAQRQAVGGVNQDEQMTLLIQFQHSYEAAARVVTTVDSMLDTIVNHMGLGN
jgi:flagellar hook-associated protein 1 FlgK